MKKSKFRKFFATIFTALISVILAVTVCLSGCGVSETPSSDIGGSSGGSGNSSGGPFINPGDSLGGGGTGTVPSEVEGTDTMEIEDYLTLELDALSENTEYDDTVTVLTGSEDTLTITAAGDYLLSGNYENGIVITVSNNEEVHLFLNNVTITNSDGIAISNTNKKSTLTITAVENSVNTIENDGTDVNAIHVKGTLNINGQGTINVNSSSKNAIKVSKGLQIVDATLNVSSANHGIAARFITANDCTINVTSAQKDGLNAECDDETTAFPEDYSEGFVALKDVEYTCNVNGDGIQADTLVYINGGNLDITTVGSFVSYSSENITTYGLETDDYKYVLSGSSYKRIASDSNTSYSSRYALSQSAKGIKVGEIEYEDADGNEIEVTDGDYAILIKNAEITVNSTDDAIHTNSGNVTITSGTLDLTTLDDGITSDYLTEIAGGNITINSCYEGIEGAYVKISGGTIDIVANDDGINAASDDNSINEYIIISGGTVTVDASGDGIDSNGSVLISGGTTIVYGPLNGGNAGLDADSGVIVTGGTLFVTSTLGMVETPSNNSTQYVVSYANSSSFSAGTVITVKDGSNNTVINVTLKKTCQSIIFSSPNLLKGSTYTVYANNSQVTSFTVSSIITTIGSSYGGMGGGNMGGPGGAPGGMGGKGGFGR